MKTTNILYWTTTSILAVMMAFAAYSYITQPAVQQGFHHLGFPDYFRIELAIAKLIGVMLLLAPVIARVKEWAYAGFGFTFISAFIAHTASGDPVSVSMMPLLFLGLLIISYLTYHKRLTSEQNTINIFQVIS